MDFDTSKENIQPLRGGRNIAQLGMALQAQNSEEYRGQLNQEKEEFEAAIRGYQGDDPLDLWFQYISWVEQSYPKQGHEGNLVPLLENCLAKFENDERYKNDRRFCRLWIKYIDLQQNPLELYHMMHAKGLCKGCADLYRAWAYYHEAVGDFHSANLVFESGRKALAQPYEELMDAHQNLFIAIGQHVISGSNERNLQEKRRALTSLRTYQPGKVSSVRVASSSGAGTLPVTNPNPLPRQNAPVAVYEDSQMDAAAGASYSAAAAAPTSILSAVKRQEAPKENTLKPGTWSAAKLKKVHGGGVQRAPSFTIHEDNLSEQGIRLPPNFIPVTYEDHSTFNPPLCHPEPYDPARVTMYPKDRVYQEMGIGVEYSIEEIRARRYMNIRSSITSCSSSSNNNSRLTVGHTETQQAIQSILGEVMQQDEDDDRVKVNLGVQNEQQLSMQEVQEREVYETYHQANEQHNQHELLQHSLQQQQHQPQHEQKLNTPNATAAPFQIYQSPMASNKSNQSPAFQIYQSPNRSLMKGNSKSGGGEGGGLQMAPPPPASQSDDSNESFLVELWNTKGTCDREEVSFVPAQTSNTSKFVIHQSSSLSMQPQMQPKGSAMKTPFRTLTAEDLAETGSRGGLDVAAAAQPGDGAKRLLNYEDDSNSSYDERRNGDAADTSLCNTEVFTFNLNMMKVSTPTKPMGAAAAAGAAAEDVPKHTCQQLFTEKSETANKMLSTILEETKSYGSSSSSQSKNTTSHDRLGAISKQHHNYLAQNMMANAALRSSLLGDLMECDSQRSSPVPDLAPPPPPLVPEPIIATRSPVALMEQVPSDPFKPTLLAMLLHRVKFPGRHSYGYQVINVHPRIQVRKEAQRIGDDRYIVEKQLGKGTFGTVFKATDVMTKRVVALKYQKPPNKWEFYICRELQSRLAHHPMRDRYMDVHMGYFHDQASVLVSTFSPCGSLLDVRNAFKQKTGSNLKQSLCIYFCIDMLNVVKTMHKAQIIHADIKPDNFLVQLAPDGTVSLHLIDFGCSIDMSMFPQGAMFTRRVTTEDFVCCEMRDGRSWSYNTDLFCVAATAHTLLFDKYIELQKKDGNWSITQRMYRYMRVDLWNTFFSALLNQQFGPADADALLEMLNEALQHENGFAGDMRALVNFLKDR